MCADPSPLTPEQDEAVRRGADSMAQKLGFSDWVEAYHGLNNFDMLVADTESHEGRCVTPSVSEPFTAKLNVEGMKRAEQWKAEHLASNAEIERLRKIEAAAVACTDALNWSGDAFSELMFALENALRGEVGAGDTAVQEDWTK